MPASAAQFYFSPYSVRVPVHFWCRRLLQKSSWKELFFWGLGDWRAPRHGQPQPYCDRVHGRRTFHWVHEKSLIDPRPVRFLSTPQSVTSLASRSMSTIFISCFKLRILGCHLQSSVAFHLFFSRDIVWQGSSCPVNCQRNPICTALCLAASLMSMHWLPAVGGITIRIRKRGNDVSGIHFLFQCKNHLMLM